MPALALRARGDGGRVGADLRLGQREGAERLPGAQGLEKILLLALAAVPGDDAGDEVVHHDDGARGAIAGGDLLARDSERGVVEARAAPLLGDRDAVQAEGREPLQRLRWKGLLAVPARGVRRELLRGEAAHRLSDLLSRA